MSDEDRWELPVCRLLPVLVVVAGMGCSAAQRKCVDAAKRCATANIAWLALTVLATTSADAGSVLERPTAATLRSKVFTAPAGSKLTEARLS